METKKASDIKFAVVYFLIALAFYFVFAYFGVLSSKKLSFLFGYNNFLISFVSLVILNIILGWISAILAANFLSEKNRFENKKKVVLVSFAFFLAVSVYQFFPSILKKEYFNIWLHVAFLATFYFSSIKYIPSREIVSDTIEKNNFLKIVFHILLRESILGFVFYFLAFFFLYLIGVRYQDTLLMNNLVYYRIVEGVYLFTLIGLVVGCIWGCNYVKNKFKIEEDKIIKIGFIPAFLPLVASFLYDHQGFGVIFFVGFFVILFFINKFLKNSAIVFNN